jgi:putative membrane protein
MTHLHPHASAGYGDAGVVEFALAAIAVVSLASYVRASARLRRRGDVWPWTRDASFVAGSVTLACAVVVPLPEELFTVHMGQHLAVAMAAPLLLVMGRPLTLALRTLPARRPRRLLLVLAHSRPAVWLTFPPLTALLDIGGLWLLYRTPLAATAHHQPVVQDAVLVHVLLAGLLFTFVICQLDPLRHRWNLAWRGLTLLAAGTSHAVLAKSLYAAPPPGTTYTTTDLHTAAQLMYYGGDLVELALAVVLAGQWYTAAGRTHARLQRRAHPCALPAGPGVAESGEMAAHDEPPRHSGDEANEQGVRSNSSPSTASDRLNMSRAGPEVSVSGRL